MKLAILKIETTTLENLEPIALIDCKEKDVKKAIATFNLFDKKVRDFKVVDGKLVKV